MITTRGVGPLKSKALSLDQVIVFFVYCVSPDSVCNRYRKCYCAIYSVTAIRPTAHGDDGPELQKNISESFTKSRGRIKVLDVAVKNVFLRFYNFCHVFCILNVFFYFPNFFILFLLFFV